jgi:hypothetical protein
MSKPMKKRMKKLKKSFKNFERVMAAATFAEAGEFETAREMMKEERRVLLGLRQGHIDRKTLKYALNTSGRIGAKLDILYVSSPGSIDPVLQQFFDELEENNILYRFIQSGGCLKEKIIEYTSAEKDILFVVIESSENLDIDCKGKTGKLSTAWSKLKCPLVVVMDNTQA